MKIFTRFVIALAASITLFAGQALASKNAEVVVGPSITVAKDVVTTIIEPRYLETKSRKKRKRKKKKSRGKRKSIVAIRNSAIKDTIGGLGELRPYTTNYNRLKAAVRRYWRRNVRHPSANGLAGTIMRYVKRKDRKLVRSDVYSGSKSGVRKVKKELSKRKR